MSLFDLFRPKWKHSDAQVRLNEIRSLPLESNQSPFIEVLNNDLDPKVRAAAASRLLDIDIIQQILASEKSPEVQSILQKRLDDRIADQILSSDAKLPWLNLTTDVKILESAALKSPIDDLRRAAFAKINKENFLAEAIAKETNTQIASDLYERLNKEDSFKKALQSPIESIRQKARYELDKLEESRKADERQRLINAQLQSIQSAVLRLEQNIELAPYKDEIDTLIEAQKNLHTQLSPELNTRLEQIHAKLNIELQSIARKEQDLAAQSEWIQQARDLCEKIEFLAREGTNKNEGEGQEIAQQWSAFVPTAISTWDFTSNWQQRWQSAWQNWIDRLNRLNASQAPVIEPEQSTETTESSANNSEEIAPVTETINAEITDKTQALQSIIDQTRNLDPNSDFETIQEHLRNAHNQWKEISAHHREYFLPLWKTFKEACAPLEEIGQWAQWHNENRKQILVDEIEALLQSDKTEAQVYQEYRSIQENWKKAGSISHEKHQELWGRFKTATDAIIQRCQSYFEQRNAEREENYQHKIELFQEIESKIDQVDAAELLKILQDRWKQIGPVSREHNDSVWEQYKALCDRLYNLKKDHQKAEHDQRLINLGLKEELIKRALIVSESTDWIEGGKAIRSLQEEWKQIGFVPKSQSEDTWNRFRAACDAFFENRRSHFENQDQIKKTNLALKVALCERIENIDLGQLNSEKLAEVEAIKEEWKQIGHVRKEDSDEIWDRFCRGTDAILEKQAENDPALQADLSRRVQLKQEIIEKAKEASESTDWAAASSVLQDLQNQWREIGRAGIKDQDLWLDFRKTCDVFFERRRDHYEILEQNRINNLEEKLQLIEEAEKIATGTHDDNARREIKLLRQRWKEIGQVPHKHADKIWKRFNTACDAVFTQENEEVA